MSGARIVTVAAGLGGTIAAFEIRAATNGKAEVTVINDQDDSWFVPSNPWVAVKWREPDAIRVHLPTIMAKRGIGFTSAGAKRVHPGENRVELNDGSSVAYDYLVLATGPDLAFDEIAGLGPDGFTQSVCRTDHAAAAAAEAFDRFCENPGPNCGRRRAGRGRRGQGHARPAIRVRDDPARLPRRTGGVRYRGADQSARLHPGRQAPAQPRLPQCLFAGVGVAIPPVGPTPVPVGVPKTGFMPAPAARRVVEASRLHQTAAAAALHGTRLEAQVGAKPTLAVLDAEREAIAADTALTEAEGRLLVAAGQLDAVIGE